MKGLTDDRAAQITEGTAESNKEQKIMDEVSSYKVWGERRLPAALNI